MEIQLSQKSSSPSSAGHSHHAGPGSGSVPAAEPSSPRSSHPHRSGQTVQGELCRRVRDGQEPPHLPGCFPGSRHPSDHIQKPLSPDASASQNGHWSLIPALAVSSCSWDRHPGDNLRKTATREQQHKAGVCGEPRGRAVLQSAPHPRTRQPVLGSTLGDAPTAPQTRPQGQAPTWLD